MIYVIYFAYICYTWHMWPKKSPFVDLGLVGSDQIFSSGTDQVGSKGRGSQGRLNPPCMVCLLQPTNAAHLWSALQPLICHHAAKMPANVCVIGHDMCPLGQSTYVSMATIIMQSLQQPTVPLRCQLLTNTALMWC